MRNIKFDLYNSDVSYFLREKKHKIILKKYFKTSSCLLGLSLFHNDSDSYIRKLHLISISIPEKVSLKRILIQFWAQEKKQPAFHEVNYRFLKYL